MQLFGTVSSGGIAFAIRTAQIAKNQDLPRREPMSTNDLEILIALETAKSAAPLAQDIALGIPIYDCTTLSHSGDQAAALKSELAAVLLSGPGAFVMKRAYADTAIIDAASDVFLSIIADEKGRADGGADHFAKAGANDRIWNSLEKLCLAAPETFARYHANPWIALAAEAWLGPGFQMTAQVNLVRPGGAAQEGHCDYHLGFMTAEQAATFPPHVHALSPQLTLQGAVAHCDMPVEAGTTKLLPHSQKWPQNYSRFRDPEVRTLFDAHHVQLPLEKGDLLFFSPGLMHGAGENKTTDTQRLANLLQISSPFGIAMETIDRATMAKAVYPVLLEARQNGSLTATEITTAIASTAEGYAFPTSLDTDPPVGGLAPKTQQALMQEGLDHGWSAEKFEAELDARQAKRRILRVE